MPGIENIVPVIRRRSTGFYLYMRRKEGNLLAMSTVISTVHQNALLDHCPHFCPNAAHDIARYGFLPSSFWLTESAQ